MQLITVVLGAAMHQPRSIRVRGNADDADHSGDPDDGGLTVGQGVVLQDAESAEFYAGTVVESGENCTVEVGEHLTPSAALGAITGLPNATSLLGVEQLAEVVGRIRGSVVPLPKA